MSWPTPNTPPFPHPATLKRREGWRHWHTRRSLYGNNHLDCPQSIHISTYEYLTRLRLKASLNYPCTDSFLFESYAEAHFMTVPNWRSLCHDLMDQGRSPIPCIPLIFEDIRKSSLDYSSPASPRTKSPEILLDDKLPLKDNVPPSLLTVLKSSNGDEVSITYLHPSFHDMNLIANNLIHCLLIGYYPVTIYAGNAIVPVSEHKAHAFSRRKWCCFLQNSS